MKEAPTKKVLIVCYYWPPSGGSGVQRWLYFVKYLREFGWEPIIFTVENGEYPYLDEHLSQEIPENIIVIKHPIWEPYDLYRKWLSKSKEEKITPTAFVEKGGFLKKLAIWIRGNVFIPDPRIFWKTPAIKRITELYRESPFDVIVSTGPPHSMHLIAKAVAHQCKIPWLADFRDPWTQGFTFSQMQLNPLARFLHHRYEKQVLRQADMVVTVSDSCKKGFQLIENRPVEVITNGYEPFGIYKSLKENRFVLLYTGALSYDRNPYHFWKCLDQFLSSKPEWKAKFVLRFIGTVDSQIIDQLHINFPNIQVENKGPIPHKLLEKALCEADALLLIGVRNDPGVLTGKLFEYMFLKTPIVSIAPKGGDIEQILMKSGCGWNADFEDEDGNIHLVKNLFEIETNNLIFDEAVIHAYSRRATTQKLAALLDKMV